MADEIIRHTISDPADIEFEPIDHGEMTIEELHDHVVATPDPLQWGCFTFGIIQSDDHFTFYASIDHVHGDAALIGITMLESHGMYTALTADGKPLALPEAGSFDDYCHPGAPVHVSFNRGFAAGTSVDRLRREQQWQPSRVPTSIGKPVGAYR